MTAVNLKPFAQVLTQHLLSIFVGNKPTERTVERIAIAEPVSAEQKSKEMNERAAFLANNADLSEAERGERIQRYQAYAALAARQGQAEVGLLQHRYQQTSNRKYRS